jgi:hypothetical protein
MYIRTNEELGQATHYDAIKDRLWTRTSSDIGQVVLQRFGPGAVQKGA